MKPYIQSPKGIQLVPAIPNGLFDYIGSTPVFSFIVK